MSSPSSPTSGPAEPMAAVTFARVPSRARRLGFAALVLVGCATWPLVAVAAFTGAT